MKDQTTSFNLLRSSPEDHHCGMSDESIASIVSSVASLVGAWAWPLLILILILRFRKPASRLLEPIARALQLRIEKGDGAEAGISVAGMSFNAKLVAASENVSKASTQPGVVSGPVSPRQAQAVLEKAIPTRDAAARLPGSTVLWVDDNPGNNTYVAGALRELGVAVTLALSTDQALSILDVNSFNAIISDMGREEPEGYHEQAGYELLERLRQRGDNTPFFIYAGSNLPEHARTAREHGAQGSTNRPAELISMVASALTKHKQSRQRQELRPKS